MCKSKDRQYNCQKKKDEGHYPQNTKQKTKDRAIRIH
jgi:hypothetical protein